MTKQTPLSLPDAAWSDQPTTNSKKCKPENEGWRFLFRQHPAQAKFNCSDRIFQFQKSPDLGILHFPVYKMLAASDWERLIITDLGGNHDTRPKMLKFGI